MHHLMQVIVVGTGLLATELLGSLNTSGQWTVKAWADKDDKATPTIVVHAGSGRELDAVADFCLATQSPLIELATGSALASSAPPFPVVLCPNTNILMLKFMSMLAHSGHFFSPYQIKLIESHQAPKTSVPGTAVSMAHSLGLHADDIRSVRQPQVQTDELAIPSAHLARHAYHQILIEDGGCSIKLETRVYGESPYADGVARIVDAVRTHALENRLYSIMELIDKGWL
jgi:4-hydroxy-tetrahydrodipicolinate reductase